MNYDSWKDHCVSRLSYELEKWSTYLDCDEKVKEKYEELRKKSLFLIYEKAAWKEYSTKGRLYLKLKLAAPGVAAAIRKLLRK